MNTSETYIQRVTDYLPRSGSMRSQIAMELRGHISERIENGRAVDEVLQQLGDPKTLAESYLSAVPLVSAPLLSRAGAKVIDVGVVIMAVMPVLWVAGRSLPEELVVLVVVATLIMGSIGFGVYTIGAEYWMGQTLGKHFLGMRVVRESGASISLGQSLVRQLPMFLQIYWIDVLFAAFTERRQRAFELLSKTRVVVVDSAVTQASFPHRADA